MTSAPPWSYLIVNADDYGYFNCVSRGILDSARHGIVTATGILANSPHFAEHVGWLKDNTILDFGVHLNITDQVPLTASIRNGLSRWGGSFPGKYAIVKALLSGTITTADVRSEWRAQIERCLDEGLEIQFLNSHEHIHMLPSLFSAVQGLAQEYHIPHVRLSSSEILRNLTIGALVRDTLIHLMNILNRPRLANPAPRFLGMGESGKLGIEYLSRCLRNLKPGQVYELMCHPGHYDAREISDSRLAQYHDWKREFDTLTNPAIREMLNQQRIRLIGYGHLKIQAGRFVIRDKKK